MKNVEKELKGIPIELRNLRLKKADQERKNQQVFNEKIALIKEITALKGEQATEKENHRKLVVKNVAEEAKSKVRENGYVVREKGLDDRDKAIGLKEDAHTDNVATLEKNKVNFEQNKTNFKKEKATFKEEKSVFSQEKVQHQENVEILEVERKKVASWSEGQKKARESANKSHELAIQLVDDAKEMKVLVEKGNKKLEEDKKVHAENVRMFNLKETEHEKEKKAFDSEKEDLKKDQEKVRARSEGLNRGYDELDKKAKEDRVKRLRVEKLIREKGIEKELKQLEKDLKK